MTKRGVKAYKLRKAGKTYREIGEYFGVTGSRARQMVLSTDRQILRAQGKPWTPGKIGSFGVL